ncbi:hypothetical protein Ava_B0201 (plasmid) [Trichormus variabilis ATCC 29413]|uniref:Uncharacterized protein n=2 Tax=Anabaena variabilis TaxID=264691 RepID=Q3M273_TRIV2|nr:MULTISPECIES: hypothetical protein [Nostocaceae]ABA24913.1 hypothetical protein Ava_B0201 [Trichormus variabilis ATCC 29413]MBC1217942.1 hypothetical protein [Trichormus variabilis ARAD]MBC1259188.1 hypothetical protein [Trichormus variabilis V5]MBC1270800.1 hypothetical protein [Trichormus variabilis FSR]MBC1305633.1 hypothetical protein [Trichormus variabilis N2B]
MNFKHFNLQPTFSVSIVSHSSQPKLANQPEQDSGYLAGVFVTSIIIGFLLGCYLRYKKFKNLRHQHSIEIIHTIKSLDNAQEQVPDIDQQMTTESRKQIEILEKIWKKSA